LGTFKACFTGSRLFLRAYKNPGRVELGQGVLVGLPLTLCHGRLATVAPVTVTKSIEVIPIIVIPPTIIAIVTIIVDLICIERVIVRSVSVVDISKQRPI